MADSSLSPGPGEVMRGLARPSLQGGELLNRDGAPASRSARCLHCSDRMVDVGLIKTGHRAAAYDTAGYVKWFTA